MVCDVWCVMCGVLMCGVLMYVMVLYIVCDVRCAGYHSQDATHCVLYVMLCYGMLWYVMVCYGMLCYVMWCYVV